MYERQPAALRRTLQRVVRLGQHLVLRPTGSIGGVRCPGGVSQEGAGEELGS